MVMIMPPSKTRSILTGCRSPLSNSATMISLQATYMKVPPEIDMKIVSTSLLVSATCMPMMMPSGAMSEKIPRKIRICLVVKPLRAKAPPNDTAAADLWITIPAASWPADSIVVYKPKAMPSNKAWAPMARTSMMAEALLTVTLSFSFSNFSL